MFIEYDVKSLSVFFSTTKFVGQNNESATIEKIAQIDGENFVNLLKDVNLFPMKMKNLQGREITLAIFNYMPYTLWKEVVSNLFFFISFLSD